jgi:hypothetical protein
MFASYTIAPMRRPSSSTTSIPRRAEADGSATGSPCTST